MLESDRIKRAHSRVIYAAYLIEKDFVSKGAIGNLQISSGDLTESIAEGPTSFTPVELNNVLLNNNVIIPELILASGLNIPSRPQNLSGLAGNTTVMLRWSRPESDGGLSITKYIINIYNSNTLLRCIDVGLSLSHVVRNLINGVIYSFEVYANNVYGSSVPSLPVSATPIHISATPTGMMTVPNAPTGVTGQAGDQQVILSWIAPSNGRSPITSFTVTASPGGFTTTTTLRTATILGLTNGQAYIFTVIATNAVGSSVPSAGVSITPATTPSAPTGVSGVAGNQQVIVSWTPPNNGGSPITSYRATSSPGGLFINVSGTIATIVGLTNGTPYTFTVVAINAIGTSTPSNESPPITPVTVPGPPTGVIAVLGNSSAVVSWTAPISDGGDFIATYTVVSNPGGFTAITSNLTAQITGLTNGTSYTFRVVATNSVGNSELSGASAPIIPGAVPDPPTDFTAIGGIYASGVIRLRWSSPINTGGSAIISYTVISDPVGITATTSETTVDVPGLMRDVEYTFRVYASNTQGDSLLSDPVNRISAYFVPSQSTAVTALKGNTTAFVSWTAPISNGGFPITSYTVSSIPGGISVSTGESDNVLSLLVTGLTNGTSYRFTVVGTNAVGNSELSLPSEPIIPAAVSDPPTDITAVGGVRLATVSWNPPTNIGGSAITSYTVRSDPDGRTASTNGTTVDVLNLRAGETYIFTVFATNSQGNSFDSIPSDPLRLSDVATRPVSVTTVPDNGQITVNWSAGLMITGTLETISFTVTSSPGGVSVTVNGETTTALITGLTNGISYTFTVVATNLVGNSAPSDPSEPVSPIEPGDPPGAPINLTAIPTDSQVVVSWEAGSAGSSPTIRYTVTPSEGNSVIVNSTVRTVTFTGLTNNNPYTFTVVATNLSGNSPPTIISATPGLVPGIPQGVSVELAGNNQVVINWNSSSDFINFYRVNVYDSSDEPLTEFDQDIDGSLIQVFIGGFSVAILYKFTLKARNNTGQGQPSLPVSITVYNYPSDIVVSGSLGDGQATISWSPPIDNGGKAIVFYRINTYNAENTILSTRDVSGNITSTIIAGLTNGILYKFNVLASNGALSSNLSELISITPGAPPSAPSVPTQIASGYDYAEISWTAPYNGGYIITSYTVRVFSETNVEIPSLNKQVTILTAVISGLTNGTTYKLSVVATNSIGSSTQSPIITVSTSTAISAPTVPQSVSINPGIDEVSVNWSVPVSDGGSAITGYRVTIYDTSNTISFVDVNSDILTTTFTNLMAGLVYRFTVSATNAIGTGPSSNQISGIPRNVPGPVLNLAGSFPTQSGTLTWAPPSNTGGSPIIDYLVNGTSIGLVAEPIVYSIYADNGNIGGVGSYNYTVVAVNLIGQGPFSTITINYINVPVAPDMKPSKAPVEIGNTQIRITWPTPASDGGSPITGFIINLYINANDSIILQSSYSASGTERTRLITGLTNGTVYSIGILASNIAGNSTEEFFTNENFSRLLTPTAVPFPPTDISSSLTTNGITVSWTAPTIIGDSAIIGYTIRSGEQISVSSSSTSKELTELVRGIAYIFKVYATNTQGNSVLSLPSISIFYPATRPSIVTDFTLGYDEAISQIGLFWSAPNNGGSEITSYTITSNLYDTIITNGITISVFFTNVTSGLSYTFVITATNEIGTSDPSATIEILIP